MRLVPTILLVFIGVLLGCSGADPAQPLFPDAGQATSVPSVQQAAKREARSYRATASSVSSIERAIAKLEERLHQLGQRPMLREVGATEMEKQRQAMRTRIEQMRVLRDRLASYHTPVRLPIALDEYDDAMEEYGELEFSTSVLGLIVSAPYEQDGGFAVTQLWSPCDAETMFWKVDLAVINFGAVFHDNQPYYSNDTDSDALDLVDVLWDDCPGSVDWEDVVLVYGNSSPPYLFPLCTEVNVGSYVRWRAFIWTTPREDEDDGSDACGL